MIIIQGQQERERVKKMYEDKKAYRVPNMTYD
jgi:hypothetical protein